MRRAERMLMEFQKKHRFLVRRNEHLDPEERGVLTLTANILGALSFMIEQRPKLMGRVKLLRVHLMLEELAELLDAMVAENEVLTLDGICDLLYVTVGTGVQLGLPIGRAFEEVHRSNMTKSARKPGDARLRDKGPKYTAPDLQKVLEAKR